MIILLLVLLFFFNRFLSSQFLANDRSYFYKNKISLIWSGVVAFLIFAFQFPVLYVAPFVFASVFASYYFLKDRDFTFVKKLFESVSSKILFTITTIAVIITLAIVGFLLKESISFFKQVNFFSFLFGTKWYPQIYEIEGSKAFGFVPIILGTVMIAVIAILVALPLGVMSAIFLSEFAQKKTRRFVKPVIELIAGVPTIVYGYFAAFTFAPFISSLKFVNISPESAFVAGIVIGIMITPYITILTYESLRAIPKFFRDSSLSLGSTKAEMSTKVLVPIVFPDIITAVILSFSRAVGETMIVVMTAGLIANITLNPFDSVTTITVQIVSLLTGDQEYGSAKTTAAFAIGLTMLVITLVLNSFAIYIKNKYKRQY